MSEKKYTPQEAAKAVLAKAEELLKKSSLLKGGEHEDNHAYNFDDTMKTKGVNKVLPRYDRKSNTSRYGTSEAGQSIKYGKPSSAKNAHKRTLEELHSMPKPDLPKSEEAQQAEESDKAFEVKPESSKSSNDARQSETQDPGLNPKEEAGAPGTNEEWGTAPETYSTLKLAKFLGHVESKRKSRSGQTMDKSEILVKSTEDIHSSEIDVVRAKKKLDRIANSNKNPKGVHEPENLNNPRAGVSQAGNMARKHDMATKEGHAPGAFKDAAIDAHKKVLKELKSIPKPNLTKGEVK